MVMHSLSRSHQAETFQQIIKSNKKYIIIEAPTGFGKSAMPAALGYEGMQQEYCDDDAPEVSKVIANVKTKSLQSQYNQSYDFKVLKGLDNYDCLNNPQITAAECEKCTNACPYPVAKEAFLQSTRGTLNYAKFLLSHQLIHKYEPDYLFLDECHQLSDIVVEFSGVEFKWQYKTGRPNYCLRFVDKPTRIDPEYGQELAWAMGVQWLRELRGGMEDQKPIKPYLNCPIEVVREWRRWSELAQRVDNTLAMVESGRELWYIKSDYEGFMCKPLTARFHFGRLFDKADKIVLMSATIGQFATFAQELGIGDYEAIQVPNSWPAPLRPIEDLGGPEYTYKMDENDRRLHASLIANRIAQCPDWWSGIVHVTSKSMANELGERLRRLMNRPIMIPFEGWSTEECLDKWLEFCSNEKGAICIWWGGWEGVDLGMNQISIVARCPYPDFKSSYEKARFEFDRRASLQRIANQIVQAWGRVRRGRDEDYGPTKLVAIADKKWHRLKNYISKDILESIG